MTDTERTELLRLIDRQVRASLEAFFMRTLDRETENFAKEILADPATKAHFIRLTRAAFDRALAALNEPTHEP